MSPPGLRDEAYDRRGREGSDGGHVLMPARLSQQAIECHANAARCLRNALAASDAKTRFEYLEMERMWLSLADCYESSKQLMDDSGIARHED